MGRQKEITDFYCKECRKDFRSEGHRGYMNSVHSDALLTACPTCESVCYRSLSDRRNDWFYRLSRRIQMARNKFQRDVMQRNDPMFDIYYPQQKREEMERENQLEKELWQKRKLGY